MSRDELEAALEGKKLMLAGAMRLIEEQDAELTRLRAQVPEWRPIETAPKDRIIAVWVAWPDAPGSFLPYCYYDSICNEWRTTRPSGHLYSVKARYVSHWLADVPAPLAAAPKPQKAGDDAGSEKGVDGG